MRRNHGDAGHGTILAKPRSVFRQGLQRVPWTGAPRELGTIWRAVRLDGSEVRCYLTTHPDGWELRLEQDRELVRTEAFSDADALLDAAEAWRRSFRLAPE